MSGCTSKAGFRKILPFIVFLEPHGRKIGLRGVSVGLCVGEGRVLRENVDTKGRDLKGCTVGWAVSPPSLFLF